MMRRARSFIAIAMSIVLVACATYDDPTLSAPPPVAEGLARANAGPACATRDTYSQRNNTSPLLPSTLTACAPVYPPELLNAGIGVACDTLFDLDAAGVPQIAETRCALTDIGGPHVVEWRGFAEAVFVAGTSRGIGLYRFNSASADKPAEIRNRLLIRTLFALDGIIPTVRPPGFENATDITKSPAPPNHI